MLAVYLEVSMPLWLVIHISSTVPCEGEDSFPHLIIYSAFNWQDYAFL